MQRGETRKKSKENRQTRKYEKTETKMKDFSLRRFAHDVGHAVGISAKKFEKNVSDIYMGLTFPGSCFRLRVQSGVRELGRNRRKKNGGKTG